MLNLSASFRWEPVTPLSTRPLFFSWHCSHPCLVKASRIRRPMMISTTTIISPPTLLSSPTSGNGQYLVVKYLTLLISQTILHRAMLNNEQDYPDPHIFKPERFLKNGKIDSSVRDPVNIAFGFGRRWKFFIVSISSSNVSLSSPFW